MGNEYQTEMDALKQMAEFLQSVFQIGDDVTVQMLSREKYKELDGLQGLFLHVKNGGELKSATIKPEHLDSFMKLLKHRRIPFSANLVKDKAGEDLAVLLFCDKDEQLVSQSISEHLSRSELFDNARETSNDKNPDMDPDL